MAPGGQENEDLGSIFLIRGIEGFKIEIPSTFDT
jgi:hypothetical protein